MGWTRSDCYAYNRKYGGLKRRRHAAYFAHSTPVIFAGIFRRMNQPVMLVPVR